MKTTAVNLKRVIDLLVYRSQPERNANLATQLRLSAYEYTSARPPRRYNRLFFNAGPECSVSSARDPPQRFCIESTIVDIESVTSRNPLHRNKNLISEQV